MSEYTVALGSEKENILAEYVDCLACFTGEDRSVIDRFASSDGVKGFWMNYETLDMSSKTKEKLREFQTLKSLIEKASYFESRDVLNNPEAVFRFMSDKAENLRKEQFFMLLLNVKAEYVAQVTVAVGDLASTVIHPREIFIEAIRRSAAGVIFVHNHPSGDPTPSKDDILTTTRLNEAGSLLGINVFDHIIVGHGRYYSFKEEAAHVFKSERKQKLAKGR